MGRLVHKMGSDKTEVPMTVTYYHWSKDILTLIFSNDVSGAGAALQPVDVYELSDNYDDSVFDLPFKPDNNIKRKMSDPELSLMHNAASSSSDLDCIIGGMNLISEAGNF